CFKLSFKTSDNSFSPLFKFKVIILLLKLPSDKESKSTLFLPFLSSEPTNTSKLTLLSFTLELIETLYSKEFFNGSTLHLSQLKFLGILSVGIDFVLIGFGLSLDLISLSSKVVPPFVLPVSIIPKSLSSSGI